MAMWICKIINVINGKIYKHIKTTINGWVYMNIEVINGIHINIKTVISERSNMKIKV